MDDGVAMGMVWYESGMKVVCKMGCAVKHKSGISEISCVQNGENPSDEIARRDANKPKSVLLLSNRNSGCSGIGFARTSTRSNTV